MSLSSIVLTSLAVYSLLGVTVKFCTHSQGLAAPKVVCHTFFRVMAFAAGDSINIQKAPEAASEAAANAAAAMRQAGEYLSNTGSMVATMCCLRRVMI